MSPAAGPTPKICIRCGQDCSAKPRTKDPQGRYTCKACLDAIEAARKAVPPPPPPPDPGSVPLIDEGLPPGLIDESAEPAPIGLQVCPGCQSSMPHGATICMQCGYDVQKKGRIKVDTAAIAEEAAKPVRAGKCPKCGYSVKGLKDPRCPECGQLLRRENERDRRTQESRETVKWAYLKPAIQFAVGIAGIAAFFAFQGQVSAIPIHLLTYVIEVPIGVIVFLACCAMWIGFDAPIHLIALRLAGVYAVTNLVSAVVGLLPLPIISAGIIIITYIGLLMESLDLDIQDAVIVGLVTGLVKIFIVVAIVASLWGA